jgi:hypothetical protein
LALESVYERTAADLATAVEILLHHRDLTLQMRMQGRLRSSCSARGLRLVFPTV